MSAVVSVSSFVDPLVFVLVSVPLLPSAVLSLSSEEDIRRLREHLFGFVSFFCFRCLTVRFFFWSSMSMPFLVGFGFGFCFFVSAGIFFPSTSLSLADAVSCFFCL